MCWRMTISLTAAENRPQVGSAMQRILAREADAIIVCPPAAQKRRRQSAFTPVPAARSTATTHPGHRSPPTRRPHEALRRSPRLTRQPPLGPDPDPRHRDHGTDTVRLAGPPNSTNANAKPTRSTHRSARRPPAPKQIQTAIVVEAVGGRRWRWPPRCRHCARPSHGGRTWKAIVEARRTRAAVGRTACESFHAKAQLDR